MMQTLFEVGEDVRCLVVGMAEDYTRISLSTAELESEDGDIVAERSKARKQFCFTDIPSQIFTDIPFHQLIMLFPYRCSMMPKVNERYLKVI